MKKQYDIKHKIQRNYIHWDVSSQCQLECSYCYAIKEYGDDWGKIDKWSSQKLVLRNIKNSTLPCFLGLLGGEPTIHPQYNELIKLSHEAISVHKDGRLYVTTNGLQSNKFFEEHKFYENMYFLWSIHFEFIDEKSIEKIFKNIQICIDKGFRNKVNVMLHYDKQYWKQIHNIIDRLETMNIEIHPHFLYDDGNVHALHNYTDEFYNEFNRFKDFEDYLIFDDNGIITKYNDYNIFHNKQTSFTGWKCWNNNYEINIFGEVQNICFNEQQSLIKNFNFFKNIKEIKPRICPHTTCNCDGLLKIYKEQ
jgi:organic radical activating enzyme